MPCQNMKIFFSSHRFLLALIAVMVIIPAQLSVVQAAVHDDLAAGRSIAETFAAALNDGMSPVEISGQIAEASVIMGKPPKETAYETVAAALPSHADPIAITSRVTHATLQAATANGMDFMPTTTEVCESVMRAAINTSVFSALGVQKVARTAAEGTAEGAILAGTDAGLFLDDVAKAAAKGIVLGTSTESVVIKQQAATPSEGDEKPKPGADLDESALVKEAAIGAGVGAARGATFVGMDGPSVAKAAADGAGLGAAGSGQDAAAVAKDVREGAQGTAPPLVDDTPPPPRGPVMLGPVAVHGGLAVGWQSRSNINLTRHNERSDNIIMLNPELGLRQDISDTSFWSAKYVGEMAFYQDYSDEDWQSHSGIFDLDLGAKKGFFVRFHDTVAKTSDPFGTENLYNEGIKTKRLKNKASLDAGYRFSKRSRIEAGYTNRIMKFDEDKDEAQNFLEHQGQAALYIGVFPYTSLLAQYRFTYRQYWDQPDDFSDDYTRHDGFLGLAWDSASFTGEIKGGYSWLSYENEINRFGFKSQEKDTWIMEANLVYKAAEQFHLEAGLHRRILQSVYFGSNYFVETAGTLGVRFWPIKPLALYASATLGKHDYNSLDSLNERSDDIMKGTLGAEYSFLDEYMFVNGHYDVVKKDSNRADEGYTDNRYYLGVGGRF